MTDFLRFDADTASYPPSILNPNPATTATAGLPGTWGPPGSTPPATVAALQGGIPNAVTAIPATGWVNLQFVQTGTPGAAGQATWTGSGWVGGKAPAALFDPAEHTIDDVKAYIEALDGDDDEIVDETQRILDAERGNLARVTLLAWLDARPGVV